MSYVNVGRLFCRRNAIATRNQIWQSPNRQGSEPEIEQLLDVGYLLTVLERLRRVAGQAPGADGIGFDDLGRMEAADVLREKREAILSGHWRPDPIRIVRIPKASGGHRDLRLPTTTDRILFAGLNDWMSPFWDRVFLERSYGFRPNRSHWSLLAALDYEIASTGKTVVVVDDVKKAFDNVDLVQCLAAHRRHLHGERLMAYIGQVLRGNDAARTIGIDQGNAYSPTALNVLLHNAHDCQVDRADNGQQLTWYRYADNLVYLVPSTNDGQVVRDRITGLLGQVGLELKRTGNQIADIRRRTIDLLGFSVRVRNGGMTYSIPNSSWTSLNESLRAAYESSNPPETARAVILGWIASLGPALAALTEAITNRIIRIAIRNGFRELPSEERLNNVAAEAYQRWRNLLHSAGAEQQRLSAA